MQAQVRHRSMRAEDDAALLRLHRRAILLEGVRAYSPAMARSWAEALVPGLYLRMTERGETVEVAELHGAAVGFCVTLEDEIRSLHVDPGFMRRGVARGLLQRALERMRRSGRHTARVIAALSAVGFYEAMGFRPVRGVRHPTGGGLAMPVLEMARELEPAPSPDRVAAPPAPPLAALRSAGAWL